MPLWISGREYRIAEHDPAARTPKPDGVSLRAKVAQIDMNSTVHVVILDGSLPGGLRPEFTPSGWLAAADGGPDYRWKLTETPEAPETPARQPARTRAETAVGGRGSPARRPGFPGAHR